MKVSHGSESGSNYSIIAPPFSSCPDSEAESGGARNFVEKSNLREDPIPPLPYALISLPESESESENETVRARQNPLN